MRHLADWLAPSHSRCLPTFYAVLSIKGQEVKAVGSRGTHSASTSSTAGSPPHHERPRDPVRLGPAKLANPLNLIGGQEAGVERAKGRGGDPQF
jgi:hypothetical protein